MSRSIKHLLTAVLIAAAPAAGAQGYYGPMTNAPASVGTSTRPSEDYGMAIAEKLGTGFANIGLSFLEIPKNVINTTNEADVALGVTGGVLKGGLHMVGRILAGVADVVTFPLPTEPIAVPQFVWENPTMETHYNPLFKLKQ